MSTCLKHSAVVGCWNKADTTKENVVIHYTYATNASGVEILKATRYTTSNGTPISLGVGESVTPGACVVCRKEIFATHDRYIMVPSAPAGFVAYEMTNDLPTQGLDVSNSYFHLIYPTLNGVTSDPIGPQLTEYFANPQNGILWSDIAGVQAVIDFVLPSMGLSVGDVVYAINTSNLPIFFLSPTAVAELANNTFLHIYWGSVDTYNNHNEKADVNVIAANPNILLGGENKCIIVQEIKERDTCTGEETYRWVVENSNGVLVPADTIIAGFDEADVTSTMCASQNGKIDTTDWLPYCVDGVQWFVREIQVLDNVVTVSSKEYKQGSDGAITTTAPTGTTIVDGICSIQALPTQRIHQNFVVTGVAPLVIPSGAISISVTKTNNTGVVNISGDNGTAFPLTFNRENFADSVNEGYSTLSAYTITGTLAGTTYKVHIIR